MVDITLSNNNLTGTLPALDNLVAIVDPDEKRHEAVKRWFQTKQLNCDKLQAFTDYRVMFDKLGKEIDAVIVATPNHHHALPSMMAMNLGKAVYCEKPLSLTIREARAMVTAVRRYGRVFQTGSQQRSSREFRFACEMVRSGRIGQLLFLLVIVATFNPLRNRVQAAVDYLFARDRYDYRQTVGAASQALATLLDLDPNRTEAGMRAWIASLLNANMDVADIREHAAYIYPADTIALSKAAGIIDIGVIMLDRIRRCAAYKDGDYIGQRHRIDRKLAVCVIKFLCRRPDNASRCAIGAAVRVDRVASGRSDGPGRGRDA